MRYWLRRAVCVLALWQVAACSKTSDTAGNLPPAVQQAAASKPGFVNKVWDVSRPPAETAWSRPEARRWRLEAPVQRAGWRARSTSSASITRAIAVKQRKDQLAIDRPRKVQSIWLQSPLPLKIIGIARLSGKVSIMP